MTPGITFNRGQKHLKLDRHAIDDAVEFPEGFRFRKNKDEAKFFKTFIDDVTRFDDKAAHHTREIYDSATQEIASWILEEPRGAQKTLSVFSPTESIRTLRTALVQCNFTDVSRLIKDFRGKILDELHDQSMYETVVTENDAIHEVIDKISEYASTCLCVVMIRQFESLRPRFLDSLISLLYSNSTCRSVIANVRMMICVSTSPTFFTQNCDIETMNMMDVKQFKFTKLDDIFSKVISTGIHNYFQPPLPEPKTIEEDDPNILRSFDCAPAIFSGPFMKYLEDRFFACDFSISALIRAIQFALLQKYLEDPLWREDNHTEELEKYDAVLKFFLKEFGIQAQHEFISLHVRIQSNPQVWKEIRDEEMFCDRKQFLFEGKSKQNLLEFCDRILKKMRKYDADFCEKLQVLKEKLEKATEEKAVEAEKSEKTPSKMSFLDLQKQRKNAMSAKQNSPIHTAKSAIFAHIMSFFETTLKPYPATWRNVIGTWKENVKLDSSDEYDIENCLLNKNSEKPLAVAWRALLCHRNFKSVAINDWAQIFLENTSLSGKKAKGAFFAAAGQLEHIGLIRGAADRKSTNVHVLYHPISFIPSL